MQSGSFKTYTELAKDGPVSLYIQPRPFLMLALRDKSNWTTPKEEQGGEDMSPLASSAAPGHSCTGQSGS